MIRRRVLGLSAAVAAAGTARWDYGRLLGPARTRSTGASAVVPTRAGAMAFAEEGSGPPVLMIHGTGGGFDQGLAFGRPSCSRGGGSSPPRASATCGPASPRTPPPRRRPALPPSSPLAAAIIRRGLRSDALLWAGIRLAPDRMTATLLATDPALVHAASPEEQARARAILHGILPVGAKARGLVSDARLAGEAAPMDLGSVRAPTLAVSVEDDRFGTAAAARHIAATVPGARLLVFPTGGHIWIGHDAELFREVDLFLRST